MVAVPIETSSSYLPSVVFLHCSSVLLRHNDLFLPGEEEEGREGGRRGGREERREGEEGINCHSVPPEGTLIDTIHLHT